MNELAYDIGNFILYGGIVYGIFAFFGEMADARRREKLSNASAIESKILKEKIRREKEKQIETDENYAVNATYEDYAESVKHNVFYTTYVENNDYEYYRGSTIRDDTYDPYSHLDYDDFHAEEEEETWCDMNPCRQYH